MSINESYNEETSDGKYGIYDCNLTLCLENESKTFLNLFKYDTEVVIEKCKWSLLQFAEISLYFFVFQEPHITDDVAKYYLEKNISNMKQL